MKPASVRRPSGQSFKKPLCLRILVSTAVEDNDMEVDTDMDETDDETEDKNEIVLGVTHHCLISFSVTA